MADSDKRETVTPPVSLPDLFFLKKNGKGGNGFVAVNFAQLETSSCGSSATKTVATFNKDHLYYTPGFVLNCDRSKCEENASIYLGMHNRKLAEYVEEKTQIMVARPSKANSFCCICKILFEDYLEHLNTPHHQQTMRSSQYCHHIKELCSRFKKNSKPLRNQRGRPNKTKHINKCLVLRSCGSGRETSAQDSPKTVESLLHNQQ